MAKKSDASNELGHVSISKSELTEPISSQGHEAEAFQQALLTDDTLQQQMLRLDNQLCFQLYAASKAVTRSYKPFLQPLQLTYPQYLVMLVLWEHSENIDESNYQAINIKQLGDKLHLDSGTLTPLLKRLEATGYVERLPSLQDGRTLQVSLSSKGLELRQKALKVPSQLLCQYKLPFEELLELKQGLQRLLAHIN